MLWVTLIKWSAGHDGNGEKLILITAKSLAEKAI